MIILHQFQGMVIGSQKLGFPPLSFQDSGGDPFAESDTITDLVIGHFMIGSKGKTDLEVKRDARYFIVLESKLYSGYTKGVTDAEYYDQAARNVACIAEVLRQAGRKPEPISQPGFYPLAPQNQISTRTFNRH